MPLPSWKEWRNGKPEKSVVVQETDEIIGTLPGHDAGVQRINEASEKQLVAIKGIGPKTAKKIIDFQPFSCFGDLLDAKIPQHVVDKLETWASD